MEITYRVQFDAAHFIEGYDGKCGRIATGIKLKVTVWKTEENGSNIATPIKCIVPLT